MSAAEIEREAEHAWREVAALPETQRVAPWIRDVVEAAFKRGFRAALEHQRVAA